MSRVSIEPEIEAPIISTTVPESKTEMDDQAEYLLAEDENVSPAEE